MTTTCKAAWSGGKCSRAPDAARGLCLGHYAQWRRQTDSGKRDVTVTYKALRDPASTGPTSVPLTVHVPESAREAYNAAARMAKVSTSELLRPWLEDGYKRHQARRKPSATG